MERRAGSATDGADGDRDGVLARDNQNRVTLPSDYLIPTSCTRLPHVGTAQKKKPWDYQGLFAVAKEGFARRSQSAGGNGTLLGFRSR
jgi:hypothetical protein